MAVFGMSIIVRVSDVLQNQNVQISAQVSTLKIQTRTSLIFQMGTRLISLVVPAASAQVIQVRSPIKSRFFN